MPKTFKVTTPVTVMSRRFMRSFEKAETNVTQAEIDLVIEQIRACFEEVVPGTAAHTTDAKVE